MKDKLISYIERGENIRNQELHRFDNGVFAPDYISGPLYDQWISEIRIFVDRNLKSHPLYKDMHSTLFKNRGRVSTFDQILGQLKALLADDELFPTSKKSKNETQRQLSLEKMIATDINTCQDYLNNPVDESHGRNLYTLITSRYAGVIDKFGNGLYSYYADQNFFDPDISINTINHNLAILLQKMITYQVLNFGNDSSNKGAAVLSSDKVFIVHGHDEAAKEQVARFIEKLGLEAIILHEQPSGGKTIIEKIEEYTNVGFAIILYTPCDVGKAKDSPDYNNRARQNVVFEHGYLISKLGRNRVCALVKDSVETPGDVSGVVYVNLDSSGAWKSSLVDEMNHAGFALDKNRI